MFHAQQRSGEVLDWSINYQGKLDGATAISSTWAMSPAEGLTLMGAELAEGVVTITASSAQGGQIFIVTNTLTTPTDVLVEDIEFYITP